MKMPVCLLILIVFAALAPTTSAQGTVTIANGTVALQNGGQLALGGHLTITGALSTGSSTTVLFTGSGDQNLTPAAGQTIDHLAVNKSGVPLGDVVLQGNLAIPGTLFITSGDLDLNGFQIDLGATGVLVETADHTVKGASGTITATRTISQPTSIAGLGIEIFSPVSLGPTTITRGHAAQSQNGNQSIHRYFDISPTTNTGLNAGARFYYDESELNGTSEPALSLFRSTDGGTTWIEEGGIVNTTDNYIELVGIDAFSRWTLAGGGLLPVELVSFEAQVDGADVVLRWQTASETNNAGFEVQRLPAEEAADWAVLGFVEGHGTTLEAQSYSYRAEALTPGRHVFRLKQIDFDGAFEYSPEVEIFVELPTAYLLTEPYPNPFNPEARFSLMVKRRQAVEVAVYDATGRRVRVVYRGEMGAEQARSLVFEAGALPSGLYLIRAVGEVFVATCSVLLVK